jgi:hypothetical protein
MLDAPRHAKPPPQPSATPAVQVQARADGALLYLVNLPPEALPPVRTRDIAAAWEAARAAAIAERWGDARFFRFRRPDGTCTDLALADSDASCWAAAVDATLGLASAYGLSVCLRLLALVDLLATAPWSAALCALRRDGAALAPPLLQAVATENLTSEGRLDEGGLRARLAPARLDFSAAAPA